MYFFKTARSPKGENCPMIGKENRACSKLKRSVRTGFPPTAASGCSDWRLIKRPIDGLQGRIFVPGVNGGDGGPQQEIDQINATGLEQQPQSPAQSRSLPGQEYTTAQFAARKRRKNQGVAVGKPGSNDELGEHPPKNARQSHSWSSSLLRNSGIPADAGASKRFSL